MTFQLLLRPIDTQFHRTGLPFDAALETETESMFPPSPRTVSGALRAFGFAANSNGPLHMLKVSEEAHRVLGDKSSLGELAIKGPVICEKHETGYLSPLIEVPADACEEKDRNRFVMLIPEDPSPNVSHNLTGGLRPVYPPAGVLVDRVQDSYLRPQYLQNYLTGTLNDSVVTHTTVRSQKVFVSEPRLGITRSKKTKSATEGLLYQVFHHRLRDDKVGMFNVLWVEVKNHGSTIPETGVLRLGGESRQAEVFKHEQATPWYSMSDIVDPVREKVTGRGKFKLVLLTPGEFGDEKRCSSRPDAVDQNMNLNIGSLAQATLVATCLQRPSMIGGWDIQKNRPRPLRSCVPAGSVYFFEIQRWDDLSPREEVVDLIIKLFHGTTELQSGTAQKEGFGLTLVGGW